ncbi:protein PAT1 homolog 1-like isoform X2 [Gigantopelta aegis]|uniref:protein PAT1 homolog 1-like isoform X2 n=1 Tax=Gigantopelta aegis TaxID=1735272 RepID=UPI001B88BB3D|nr:protein PAT1 homolog 1-like isoform X2 [Gigantopelta aegis]
MDESRVSGGSGLSALGAGKLNPLDNELIEAPEDEEDFDILNDETFGDIPVEPFDWHEQHERFAEELSGSGSFYESRQNGHAANRTCDSGFGTTEKNYISQEEFLEQSISQLVVDDDESCPVSSDPAIVNISTSRDIPLPYKEAHLENLFGPASPPSFLDTEHLLSPTSRDIWGSPAGDSSFPKPVDNLQALFNFAKVANNDVQISTSSPAVTKSKSAVPQSPSIPAYAQTLAEIENQLLKKKPVKVMTAENLERELRGETASPTKHEEISIRQPGPFQLQQQNRLPFSMPVPIPPIGRTVMQNIPQSNIGFSPISHYPDGRNSPLQFGSSPLRNRVSPIPTLTRQSPVFIGIQSPLARSFTPPLPVHRPPSPVQARFMSPYNQTYIIGNATSPQNVFNNAVRIPQSSRGPGMPFVHMGSPHGPRITRPMVMSDPGFGRGYLSNRGRHFSNNQHFEGSPVLYHDRPSHNTRFVKDNRPMQVRDNHRTVDEYDGLMTQKEKDWIVKIQLMQLQTDNPYLDDYYYTCYTLKKKAIERQKLRESSGDGDNKNDPKLVIPNLAKMESRAYMPAQFEGSLGRLTTASVHNPRQIIDLARNISQAGEESKNVSKELRRFRQLLMDIEKGFNILLDIDDLEKKVLALPEDSRIPLLEERQDKINLLYSSLSMQDYIETFIQIMSVRKGRKLLSRVLPYLSKAQAAILVSLILCNLGQLMKKDQKDEGMVMLTDAICQAIGNTDLDQLVELTQQISEDKIQEKISALMQNKFGSSLLCSMLRQGENILKNTSPVDLDNQMQTAWSHFVEEFVEALTTIPKESIVSPNKPHQSIMDHLDRQLNKELIADIEDKISVLTSIPGTNRHNSESK